MTRQITTRFHEDDAEALARVKARLPMLSKAAIGREALRIGLAALERDPLQIIRTQETGKP